MYVYENKNNIKKIGENAFSRCGSIESIVIPLNVKTIKKAFVECHKLSIYCEVEMKPEGWYENWNTSNRSVYYAGEWEYIDGLAKPL